MYIYRAKETPRRNGQIRVPGRTNRQTREIAARLRVHGGYIISVCVCVCVCVFDALCMCMNVCARVCMCYVYNV